ncbi:MULTISPECIES: exostosin family protein [unclassified Algoriphagus]|jgi:hypothetical protein|uniref:exostosin domain-containing protein n=1 Tax=unclassified Algoriphagus TaxID=2641541 RepID=UPI000C472A59|nr:MULTISPECIES: exostosin family protein [unclassified Algoriphagus]MAL14042.1 hypothetical protein [Algoriphagus sp.]MAN85672.1 hypothetical protein [Algoriphagus sp.]HAS58141.1 hypothetical protein [Algoriphagus sp.]|tara:strand:- start:508 stop:1569 length:1062 start_codon:yes stop_codon:yes gene_type:complete
MIEKDSLQQVKLYFDQSFFSEGYVFDLFLRSTDGSIQINSEATDYFTIVEKPEDADLIFIPVPLSELVKNQIGREKIKSHVQIGRAFNKKVFVVSDADLIFNPGFDDVIILTPGAYKSLPNQISIPALLPKDPYSKWVGEVWEPIQDLSRFSVGFCGQATSHGLKYLKDRLQYLQLNAKKLLGDKTHLYIPFFFAASERAKILNHLEKSSLIDTDFLKRERYKGGGKSEDDLMQLESEFFENINRNLFTVCIRGFGNYSVRFFQTLAMGRIPVVIESDSLLPFESQLNYDKFIVKVPFENRLRADKYIHEFLKDKTLVDLQRIQSECRKVWLDYFRKPSYFKAMNIELRNYLR